MNSETKQHPTPLQQAVAEANPSAFLREILQQASQTVLVLGEQLEAEKKKSHALELELEAKASPPPPSIHDAIRILVRTYQTCGRCVSWKDYDRSQTDTLGRCQHEAYPFNRKEIEIRKGKIETQSDFSCSHFAPRP